ncbi:MAG: translation initiation factor IF-2 [Clostridia bacterium]|nr:translation initiation factor IF-2 [Clostridia bacterium]
MANQALENLKKIHVLQKEGEISKLLQELKSSKTQVDELGRSLSARLKAIDVEFAQKKAVEAAQQTKQQEEKEVKVVVEEKKPATAFVESSNNFRKFNDRPQGNQARGENNYRGQNNRFENRNADRNGNNRFNNNNFNRDRKDGPRPPFNPNRQNNNQQGPRKFGNNNFVSAKANNFKSFASNDAPEIDVKNDRNYANKAKYAQKHSVAHDEKKGQGKRREEGGKRNNVFIEGENGFEEISFGSRKSVKKKKEQTNKQVTSITHAVLTSKEITVKDFSEKIGKPVTEIVKKLMLLGIMATINSNIDFDTAELIASEFGVTLELKADKSYEEKLMDAAEMEDDASALVKRAPIVAVMGHVDHGKTSLLDAFRKTNVVLGEAGGITQSIGAYQIEFNGEKITFIDTPGHAAFTQMRARGAKATDIAILVVAADDGVMPQTVEAINHIKAANVPVIVAINKMDKPEAKPERIKQQLAENNILPEEWGGDAICVPISAKTGMGLDDLKQTILLVSEMCELKANPDKMATAVVIEAELDKNRGPVASVIVQNGTLRVGDSIMSGITYGKVRAMFNDQGKPIKAAGPSTPVEILGFNEVPVSGDEVYAVEETLSKQVIQERIDKIKKERAAQSSGVTLDNFMNRVQEGALKNLNVIIKTDTMGSVEAIKSTLLGIRNEEAKVNVVHSGAGAVTESDVILAQTTGSVIICFNQKPVAKAKALAENMKLEIKEYKIIYEIVDDITAAINGMLSIKYEEVYIGNAEIRMVFKLSTAGKVAGSYIKDGKATRNAIAVVKRGNEEIGKTTVESLKIVKDEKAEVAKGYECGIKLRDNIDYKEGDIIEFYSKVAIKR